MLWRLLLILPLLVFLASSTLILSSQTITPLTASSSNTAYLYSLTSTGRSIAANSQFFVQFETGAFDITQASACSFTLNGAAVAAATCTVNSGANTITFGNVITTATTVTSLTVGFNSSGAIYSGNLNMQLYFVDSSGVQITDTWVNTTVSIVTAPMTTCSVSNAHQIVGSSTTFVFGFTPVVNITSGSILQIVLPAWFGNATNFVNNASVNCSQNCSATLSSSSESVIFRRMFNSTTMATQSVEIYSIKNPTTTQPISISIIIQTSTNYNVQRCSVNLSATTPNNLRATFPITSTSISAVNSIRLSFRNTNPIQVSASYLRISSPLTMNYTYASANSTSTTAPARTTSTDGSLLISGLAASNIAANSIYNLGLFSMSNPPSTKKVTLTFTTETLANGTYYLIDMSTIDITATASTITTAAFVAQTTTAYSVGSSTFSFIIVNALISDSYAVIQFPAEMSVISTSTCTTSFGSCSINSNTVTLDLNASYAAGTNLSVSLSQVRNPLTTLPTSTFSISTYYNSSDSLVDQMTTGLTFTAIPNPIKEMVITPASLTVGAVTTYSFQVNFTNPVPVGTVMTISFPSAIPLTAVTFPSSNTLPCVASLNAQTVTLTGCITAQTSGQLTFVLGGITNPLSTKPTDTFNITSTLTNLLEYMSSNRIVTMTTPMSFTSISISASNTTVNALTSYTFTVGFGTTHYNGDRLVLTIPSELTITNPQCVGISGIASLSCSMSGNTILVRFTAAPSSQV